MWSAVLTTAVRDACLPGETAQSAQVWFSAGRFRRDRVFIELALGLENGTIEKIGRELEARGWTYRERKR